MLLFIIVAVIYIGLVIFFAQRKAPNEYNYKENTISELACQTYENRWIMQWGFKGFGLIILIGVIVSYEETFKELHYTIPLTVYALSFLMSGFFSTKPFEHLVFYSMKESKVHSAFAQLAGFALSMLVVMKFVVVLGYVNRIINALFLLFILYNSVQMGRDHEKRGIYQRVMYFGSFMWLIYAYSSIMN